MWVNSWGIEDQADGQTEAVLRLKSVGCLRLGVSREPTLVHHDRPRDELFYAELAKDPFVTCVAESLPDGGIAQHLDDCGGQRCFVARWDESSCSAVLNRLRNTARSRRHDGASAGH